MKKVCVWQEELIHISCLDSSKSRRRTAIPFNYGDDSKIEEEEEDIRVMTAIEKEIMIKYKTPNSMHVVSAYCINARICNHSK